MSSRNMPCSNLNFSGLTPTMSLRYIGNELFKHCSNTVISFSCRDCAGFLFVGNSMTHCVPCLGGIWFLFCALYHRYLATFVSYRTNIIIYNNVTFCTVVMYRSVYYFYIAVPYFYFINVKWFYFYCVSFNLWTSAISIATLHEAKW